MRRAKSPTAFATRPGQRHVQGRDAHSERRTWDTGLQKCQGAGSFYTYALNLPPHVSHYMYNQPIAKTPHTLLSQIPHTYESTLPLKHAAPHSTVLYQPIQARYRYSVLLSNSLYSYRYIMRASSCPLTLQQTQKRAAVARSTNDLTHTHSHTRSSVF